MRNQFTDIASILKAMDATTKPEGFIPPRKIQNLLAVGRLVRSPEIMGHENAFKQTDDCKQVTALVTDFSHGVVEPSDDETYPSAVTAAYCQYLQSLFKKGIVLQKEFQKLMKWSSTIDENLTENISDEDVADLRNIINSLPKENIFAFADVLLTLLSINYYAFEFTSDRISNACNSLLQIVTVLPNLQTENSAKKLLKTRQLQITFTRVAQTLIKTDLEMMIDRCPVFSEEIAGLEDGWPVSTFAQETALTYSMAKLSEINPMLDYFHVISTFMDKHLDFSSEQITKSLSSSLIPDIIYLRIVEKSLKPEDLHEILQSSTLNQKSTEDTGAIFGLYKQIINYCCNGGILSSECMINLIQIHQATTRTETASLIEEVDLSFNKIPVANRYIFADLLLKTMKLLKQNKAFHEFDEFALEIFILPIIYNFNLMDPIGRNYHLTETKKRRKGLAQVNSTLIWLLKLFWQAGVKGEKFCFQSKIFPN